MMHLVTRWTKLVVISAKTDDALTAGEAVLNVYWTQQINNTN